ncbi:MAG: hypothetical protein J6K64_00435 [Clostridia bacterium]|nr:hypothetical protein [Clostridia bacterium]
MKKDFSLKKKVFVFMSLLVCICVCLISVFGAIKKEQYARAIEPFDTVNYNTEASVILTNEQKETSTSVNITEQTQKIIINQTDERKQNEISKSFADIKEENTEQTKLKAMVSYASSWNHSAYNSLVNGALNKSNLNANEETHLPIFKIDTQQELERLMSEYGEDIFINEGYDEMPSFEETAKKYDEDFFERNTLLLVYVSAPSGTLRFGLKDIDFNSDSVCVHIRQTNNPQVFTDDVAGWIVSIEVSDSNVNDCEFFDAVLDKD